MKKYLVIMMFAIAAFGFIGCSSDDDNTKADLRWDNQDTVKVTDIKWSSGGVEDQSWSGDTLSGNKTDFKGISKLSGSGDCLDDSGNPATIELRNTSTGVATAVTTGETSATIEENASATLVIDNTSTK